MKKPKILLLSDDIRLPSGVGTVSMELVKGTCDRYDWVQLAGAVDHPEKGKRIDFSDKVREITRVPHASVTLYPVSGYGDQRVLREVMRIEKPDMIMHFTDPRFWGWLYDMEHEVRQQCPISYLTIWDDLPYPRWNENCYESCDLLMAINRQTYNIIDQVRQRKPVEDWQLKYVPHGINDTIFRPINTNSPEYDEAYKSLIGERPGFLYFYNARNIQRKRTTDMLYAFNMIAQEQPDAHFLLHCPRVDQAGTDLGKIIRDYFPADVQRRIHFYEKHDLSQNQLNVMYNMADVTVLVSSAEGFGLSCAESLMAGTPVIVNCVGGIQDQIGLMNDSGEYLTVEDYNNDTPTYSYQKTWHGKWAFVTWPQVGFQGSPMTYGIFDSRASIADIATQMQTAYAAKDHLTARGLAGRDYLINDSGMSLQGMIDSFIESVEGCWANWAPPAKFGIYQIPEKVTEYAHSGAPTFDQLKKMDNRHND